MGCTYSEWPEDLGHDKDMNGGIRQGQTFESYGVPLDGLDSRLRYRSLAVLEVRCDIDFLPLYRDLNDCLSLAFDMIAEPRGVH